MRQTMQVYTSWGYLGESESEWRQVIFEKIGDPDTDSRGRIFQRVESWGIRQEKGMTIRYKIPRHDGKLLSAMLHGLTDIEFDMTEY